MKQQNDDQDIDRGALPHKPETNVGPFGEPWPVHEPPIHPGPPPPKEDTPAFPSGPKPPAAPKQDS